MFKFSNLTTAEQKTLKMFKREVKQKLDGQVLAIKLFGSKARGDFNKNSDFDILVLLKKDGKRERDGIFDAVAKIVLSHGVYLSVKIFSLGEFNYLNSIPTVFMKNIAREAVAL